MDGSGLAERVRDVPVGAAAFALARVDAGSAGLLLIAAGEARADAIARIVRALRPDLPVFHLPRWDVPPAEGATPDRAVMGRRMAVLAAIAEAGAAPLVVASPAAVMQVAPPPAVARATRSRLAIGDAVDPEALERSLRSAGWVIDDRVDEPGEAAIRGQVIDLFPPDADRPVRIAHAGGRVTGLNAYDPVSQRTVEALTDVVFGAATEAGGDEADPPGDQPRGFLPRLLAHGPARGLLGHWPRARLLAEPGALARLEDAFAEPVSGGTGLLSTDAWTDDLGGRPIGCLDPPAVEGPRFSTRRDASAAFARHVEDKLREGRRVLLISEGSAARALVRRLKAPVAILPAADALAAPGTTVARTSLPLAHGFDDGETVVITAADVLGSVAGAASERGALPSPFTGDADPAIGDVVVHRDHGLGLLLGLETVEDPDGARDLLRIEHAGGAVRMLPVEEMGGLWRYGGSPDAIALDRLDGTSWVKRRGEVEAAIAAAAEGLAAAAAARADAKAPVYRPPIARYERFAGRFAYPETPDQAAAIEAVLGDLAAGRPMDRLVCGDVGFGKTEVALRAAAAVALAGGQVAIVAPTTVLARQHEETLRRRFAGFGIEVGALSRFTPPAEARRVKAGLADGSIAVVVGTHAVTGRGVVFRDLGLIVVDEEQRFGAEQKAAFRQLAAGRHHLALTATPIPRTLQGSLAGLVDLSVIATPPVRRQPIRTLVAPFDEAVVADALRREAARGGQSFVVAPRIADLAPLAERLARLVPELTLRTVHARKKAADIDEALVGFARGEGDILLATSLIESGLDIPRANALVVWHADRFGLSELHQLRGRVGRGGRRAVVHLTVDPAAEHAPATMKRLTTLAALDRLGAGFAIAAADLDQRGAGDLFGEEQAGHVKLIGAGYYRHLMARALRRVRGEDPGSDAPPSISVGAIGVIPAETVPEPDLRIALYARLAAVGTPDDADAFLADFEDRFGPAPDAVRRLAALARLKAVAVAAGATAVLCGPDGVSVTLASEAVGTLPEGCERRGDKIVLRRPCEDVEARLALAVDVVDALTA